MTPHPRSVHGLTPAPDTDVLVVGAGPTGMVAAAELAKRGIRCRLIDKALERSEHSRALIVQPRSLEVLRRMGALGDLLGVGQRSLTINIHVDGRRVAGIPVDDIGFDDTPFPFVLFVSQAETERVLEDHLAVTGVRIDRGVELVGLRDAGDLVEADLETGSGTETIRTRYVVGADGAHSAVRSLVGLNFRGDAYPQDFALADVDIGWEHQHGGVHLFFGRRGVFACLPIRGEQAYRILMVRGKGTEEGELTLDEVRHRARDATGRELRIENPRWLARFRLHHRGVDAYRIGRVFVAGDAAHIHSPAGGQGMNTGIQDAFNLGWKLALVIQGSAPDSLLDSYHAERHPIGKTLLRFTDRLFRLGASEHWLLAQLRRVVVPRAAPFTLNDRRRRARAFAFVSQLGVRYDWSPIVEEPGKRGLLGQTPAAGWRAPDATLGDTTLFEQMSGTGFHLLCFSETGEVQDRIAEALREARRLVTPLAIRRGADTAEAFERYGVAKDAYYLVRPDGYITTRSSGDDPTTIIAHLTRLGGS